MRRRLLRLLLLVPLVPLVAPAAAGAATVAVEPSNQTVFYVGGTGEANHLTVAFAAGRRSVTVTDPGAIVIARAGCAAVDAHTATCSGEQLLRADVRTGDRDDSVTTSSPDDGGGIEVDGGLGDDRLTGGPGSDRLVGGGGRDELRGGDGDDTIFDADAGSVPIDADRMDGGPGRDMLSYRGRSRAVRVNLATTGTSGAGGAGGAGEDDVVSGVEDVAGGRGDDRLLGGAGRDALDGGSGADVLACGRGGGETAYGVAYADRLDGCERAQFADPDSDELTFVVGAVPLRVAGRTATWLAGCPANVDQESQACDGTLTLKAGGVVLGRGVVRGSADHERTTRRSG